MTDAVQRAYATLGLPASATTAQVKRRYRLLVKRWHPDRFANDSRNQAEATEHLAQFNVAYHLLIGQGHAEGDVMSATNRLTREQVDRMVQSIGSEGPVDWLLGWFERVMYPSSNLRTIELTPVSVAIALVLVVVLIVLELRYGHWVADPAFVAIVIIGAVISWLTRSG
jgi:hypothetical protein